PAGEGDGRGGESLPRIGQVALAVQHLEDAGGAAVEEERVVELGRDGACAVVQRLRQRHRDRERPEIRPGDLDDRRLGQRGEGAEQETQGQDANHREVTPLTRVRDGTGERRRTSTARRGGGWAGERTARRASPRS